MKLWNVKLPSIKMTEIEISNIIIYDLILQFSTQKISKSSIFIMVVIYKFHGKWLQILQFSFFVCMCMCVWVRIRVLEQSLHFYLTHSEFIHVLTLQSILLALLHVNSVFFVMFIHFVLIGTDTSKPSTQTHSTSTHQKRKKHIYIIFMSKSTNKWTNKIRLLLKRCLRVTRIRWCEHWSI